MEINNSKQVLGDVFRSALNHFLSDDPLRPALQSPFIQDDYVIATDAVGIILFKKEKLNEIDFVSHKSAPNALAVVPSGENMDVVFETKLLRQRIFESNKAASERYRKEVKTCPDCNGICAVDFEFVDYSGQTHELEGDCPTCEFKGKIESVVNIQTGEIVTGGYVELIKIGSGLLATRYIEKIVKVAEMFEQKTIQLVYATVSHAIHKFKVGDCTIGLMPLLYPDDNDVVTTIA